MSVVWINLSILTNGNCWKLIIPFWLFCREECCHSDFCMDAHSEEELKEWQGRCGYRDEKKNVAIESNLYIYDYIDNLREQHFHSGHYQVSLYDSLHKSSSWIVITNGAMQMSNNSARMFINVSKTCRDTCIFDSKQWMYCKKKIVRVKSVRDLTSCPTQNGQEIFSLWLTTFIYKPNKILSAMF